MQQMKYLIMSIFGFIAFAELNFNYLSPEQTVIVLGVLGTFFGVIYNTDYIRRTGVKGFCLGFIAIFIWVLFVQLFFDFWALNLTLANLLAFTGGIFVFYTLSWVMNAQPKLLTFVFQLLFGALQKHFTNTDIKPIDFSRLNDTTVEPSVKKEDTPGGSDHK